MRFAILLLLLLASGTTALGQERPIVRAAMMPEVVAVGEAAELTVTVLVPTWFTRPPVYPSFELANAITRQPADNSYPIRERVGSDSWSGIVRSYEVYPLLGATYRLSGQSMSIAYADPGKDPVIMDVELPEIVFRGSVPGGAETLHPYIAGRSLALSLEVDGATDALAAGDALVLSYVAELDGLPAIFIPPLAPDMQLEGVSVYADEPVVEDGTPARRSEKVTLVFNAGGDVTIPGIELSFWNTASGALETVSAAGLKLTVQGPVAVTDSDTAAETIRWTQLATLAGGLLLLILALRHWVPLGLRQYRDAALRRRQSEPYAFDLLARALRSGSNDAAYKALLAWIERLAPGMDTRRFASSFGDESLGVAIDSLSAAIHSGSGMADLGTLRTGLRVARKRYLREISTRRQAPLPPLNP